MAKKTAKEKLYQNSDKLPEIKELDNAKYIEKYGNGKMVIPAPLEINELIRKVPEGYIVTTEQLRNFFNEKYDAVYTCPLCTGIFTNIVAQAAEEDLQDGDKDITPYWRTLKTKGEINPKFPGGIEKQIELLQKEGHKIKQKGKKFFVEEYQNAQFVL